VSAHVPEKSAGLSAGKLVSAHVPETPVPLADKLVSAHVPDKPAVPSADKLVSAHVPEKSAGLSAGKLVSAHVPEKPAVRSADKPVSAHVPEKPAGPSTDKLVSAHVTDHVEPRKVGSGDELARAPDKEVVKPPVHTAAKLQPINTAEKTTQAHVAVESMLRGRARVQDGDSLGYLASYKRKPGSTESLPDEAVDGLISRVWLSLPHLPTVAHSSMSLWVTGLLSIAIVAILLFIGVLIRFIHDGYEVHWMAGLPAKLDWKQLSDGDFVKVVGHVVALPGRELVAPLSRTQCVAYSVAASSRGDHKPANKSVMQVKSFCVQDDQGRLMLVQGHETVLYNLTTAKEWTYSAATAPKEFQAFAPKDHSGSEGAPVLLRYREEVLEVGAKVCCVGAVSTQPTSLAPVSLRPAYATLMFRDAQIPWEKLSSLSTADWGKVAASVLVTSYRLGR